MTRVKRSSENLTMYLFTFAMVSLFSCHCLAYEIFEEEKRQQLYPFPRIGRGSNFWDFVEDKRLGGLMPFPRVGRTDGKRQGLIPFPRIGRSIDIDYDESTPYDVLDTMYDLSFPVYKRGKMAFQPRVGRSKRSIKTMDEKPQSASLLANVQGTWRPVFDDSTFYYRPGPQPFAAIGKDVLGISSPSFVNGNAFDKRALVPRVGRSDGRIQTRAMLQPRIGRALVPRVGRSDHAQQEKYSKD